MATAVEAPIQQGGYKAKFKLGMIGSAAPVFPGFEVDIGDRVPDKEKPDAVWHRDRAKAMLRTHPEIKSLFGRSALSAFWCLLFAGLQLVLAAAVSHVSWWAGIALAWIAGAWINVCLFQLAHECNHGLVFKKNAWNRWLFTFTSLPMFLSGHHTWWVEHLVHHNDLGAKKDFITRRRTFFLITRYTSPLFVPYSLIMLVMQLCRSVVGLAMYAGGLVLGRVTPGKLTLKVLSDEHLASGYEKERVELWAVLYPVLHLVMLAGLAAYGAFLGTAWWKPIVYLYASQAFMTGFLHPFMLGIVLAISHFHGRDHYQPSASHYGWLNWIGFNIGYHVEHHDLAGIPWFRLPQLRKIAPEFYNNLEQIPSYTRLALDFVFGGNQSFHRHFDNEAHRNAARFGSVQPPEGVGQASDTGDYSSIHP